MSDLWEVVVTRDTGAQCTIPLSPSVSLECGRAETLPPQTRLDHKYISRSHITWTLSPGGDSVTVAQRGKNPTLVGPSSEKLHAGATKTFSKAEALSAKKEHARHTAGCTTLHFPADLRLPMFHVYCTAIATPAAPLSSGRAGALDANQGVGAAEGQPEQTVERMLTVPVAVADDENPVSEEDEAPPPARQLRLLDEALQQQIAANAVTAAIEAAGASYVAPAATVPSTSSGPSAAAHPVAGGGFARMQRAHSSFDGDDLEVLQRPPPPPPPPRVAAAKVVAPPPPSVISDAPKPIVPLATQTPQPCAEGMSTTPMGMWEWKCHVDGDDADPKNWRKYPKATADMLEAEYRKDGGRVGVVAIDHVYHVCFDDKHVGMIQFRKDDPGRWRSIRRRGGGVVSRPHARKRVVAKNTGMSSSSSVDSRSSTDDDDSHPSWIVSDSSSSSSGDEDDSDTSFDTESSIETQSSSSGAKRRRRNRKLKKKQGGGKKPPTKKREREDGA